jgi:DNA-binding MarR family transcriptional regulator
MREREGASWVDRSESLGYQVNFLARLLATLLQREIEIHGVVPGQFAQLLALYDADGQTPTELCRAVGVEPGTMTKTLQRMERDGLIERRRSPSDGRSVTVHLTERARQLEPVLKEAAARVNAQVTRSLSDRQVLTFMRTLTEIVGEAEQLVGPR